MYFTMMVRRSDGIEWKFFSFFVAINIVIGLTLIISTLYYTNAMHEMWGSSFDSAITRVTSLTFALVLGLAASSGFMIALILCPEEN